MATTVIAIDDRLTTAMYAYPVTAGWVDADGIALERGLRPDAARQSTIALLDSVYALTMLDTHVILRDAGIVWRTASMLTMTTHTRPDEVEQATIAIPGISAAGRAVATAVITSFYGITITRWVEDEREVDETTAVVSEDAAALIADENEDHYQEDLGRAWFLLANLPFVSHVCVAPRALLASDPAAVAVAVERLNAAKAFGQERGRELRRDLSKGFNIDREMLTETLADQSHTLDDEALDGLVELAKRTGLGVAREKIRSAAVRVTNPTPNRHPEGTRPDAGRGL
ncbi:MAG TPA: MqnA/MqnD/SBP family protein [Thermomicrobiales bacterium]|nr:MqnA/MqnD/SBP family protein [Thermomicrobiales bacterium]